jgi:serine/threonine-protein kinase RsbW
VDAETISVERRNDLSLHLSIPNHRNSIEPARQMVLEFLSRLALRAEQTYNIELILEETLMNAILHAFKDRAPHRVELTVQIRPIDIVLHFEDDGVSFDPLHLDDHVSPTSIDTAVPGGLGLVLVRKFASSITYRRGNGRNFLTIGVAR